MGRIVFIRQVVERQVFAEMSTAARDVGLVWSMIVQGIVTGALLDRVSIVGTYDDRSLGFFGELLEEEE